MTHAYKLWIALAAGAAALGAHAQSRNAVPVPEAPPPTITPQPLGAEPARPQDAEDVEFLTEALRTSIAEVRMGELAQQRGGSPAVRDFGQQLQADHAQLAERLEAEVRKLDVVVPQEPTLEAQAHYEALAKLPAAEFDAAFANLMVASHEEAIEQYGAQTHANPDQQLHELAMSALPTLRAHLDTARRLQGQSAAPRPGS